jgi:hypothetical protein
VLGTGANSTTGAHSPPANRRRIWQDSKSTFQPGLGFVRTQLLPQAVRLDQHMLRISKLLLRLVAKPTKISPVPIFALGEPLDQFEVTSARISSTVTRRAFHGWCPRPSFSNCCNWSSRLILREGPTPTFAAVRIHLGVPDNIKEC